MPLIMTEEDFAQAAREKAKEKNVPFVLAVYMVLEECLRECLSTSGIQLACRQGCSACCYQMVTCTPLEFEVILRYVNSLTEDLKQRIIMGTNKVVGDWRRYHAKNPRFFVGTAEGVMKVHRDWNQRPCPFLSKEDGSCRIYPVRPIDCRTFTSLETCQRPILRAERFRFDPEKWVNNLILGESVRKTGVFAVTPLHHWISMVWPQGRKKPAESVHQ
jgi:Fe-S-cluster containining protein